MLVFFCYCVTASSEQNQICWYKPWTSICDTQQKMDNICQNCHQLLQMFTNNSITGLSGGSPASPRTIFINNISFTLLTSGEQSEGKDKASTQLDHPYSPHCHPVCHKNLLVLVLLQMTNSNSLVIPNSIKMMSRYDFRLILFADDNLYIRDVCTV